MHACGFHVREFLGLATRLLFIVFSKTSLRFSNMEIITVCLKVRLIVVIDCTVG